MLSNAILDNMLESIVRDIAAPELDRSCANERIAAQLAEDIASSLTDYTSAFIAYEVAYREVMTAKADAFRKRALASTVFSQWQMEVTAREQEAALRQQYIDDLKTIVDSAPALQPPRSLLSRQPMMISPAHSRTQSNVSSVSMQSAQAC
ncbi:hypothetical protein DL89DRAFT_84762 [Linderina pennispora]|uniref:Uncharacterized protein n=1 Tax=Linderina pennispora TaxID=61395 RepID=A0A1Y1WHB6_9FUNG|nr:uncharacterized protein DL89DRAFT_84762 [Linderina pennispora]ORX72913.1 hypothetical protein DL89DRAFT_84762 [Linderina pennispora]